MYHLCKYVHQIIWLMCLDLPWLESKEHSVVSWNVADPGVIPYQVAIRTPFPHQDQVFYTICSAVLIGRNKALSSARCYFKYDPVGVLERLCNWPKLYYAGNLYAVAGTVRNIGRYQNEMAGNEQWRRIYNPYIYHKYSFPYGNLAVAITTTPFVYTEYVKPIPVAKKYSDFDSMDCEVSGFGNVSNKITSDSLLWTKVDPLTNRHCTFLNSEDMRDFICTQSLIGNVLQDYSGGSLVCRKTGKRSQEKGPKMLVGIISGEDRFKAVLFSRLSSHSKFIESSRSQLNKPTTYLCILLFKLIRLMISFLFYFRKMLG